MKKQLIKISDLSVSTEGKTILDKVSFNIDAGKIIALMGPNGSGKSSLSYVIAGHPKYQIDSGKILFEGEDISQMPPDERARRGIFLSFQYPKSIPGVSLSNFLRASYKAVKKKDIRVFAFQKILKEKMKLLKISESFINRFVNEGFSGGEKKKVEILQAMILEPKLIIMDETDSGLDVDALKLVAKGVETLINEKTSVLLITHYFRILEYLKPDEVQILKKGKIVKSGGAELAKEIESNGFDSFNDKHRSSISSFSVLD